MTQLGRLDTIKIDLDTDRKISAQLSLFQHNNADIDIIRQILAQFGKFRHNYADLGTIRQNFDSLQLQTHLNRFRLDRFRHNCIGQTESKRVTNYPELYLLNLKHFAILNRSTR